MTPEDTFFLEEIRSLMTPEDTSFLEEIRSLLKSRAVPPHMRQAIREILAQGSRHTPVGWLIDAACQACVTDVTCGEAANSETLAEPPNA